MMSRTTFNQASYKIFGISFFIILITLIVYLPALQNDFVNFDDNLYVYENQEIQSIDSKLLYWIPSVIIWHPITMLSLAIDYAAWGLNPLGYHLTNILLHTFNTFLVFIMAIQLIGCGIVKNRLEKKILVAAAVTALLFGIHPLHVESVAWISERKDVLSGFFYLLSLLAYFKYVYSMDSKRLIYYGACLIFFIMALMSKPTAVSLPLVLLILDFYPLGRLSNLKAALVEKLPFLALSLLLSLITIWVHQLGEVLKTLETYPLMLRIFVALRAFIFYLVKMILPFNLAPYYPYPGETAVLNFEYLMSLILVIAISLFCIRLLKRDRIFTAIWLYYIITLIPAIGIVKVGSFAAADRHTYLPSLGPFLLIGLAIGAVFERCSKKYCQMTIIVVLTLLASVLASKTIRQITLWHDSIILWSHVIKLFPNAYLPYINRGNAYYDLRKYRQAIDDYDRAIEIYPKRPDAYVSRGTGYYYLADYMQAIDDSSKAIELDPGYAEAYMNRGNAYDMAGKSYKAINDYNKAIQIDPQNAIVYFNLGIVYSKIGERRLAFFYYKKSASLGLPQAAYKLRQMPKE